VAGKISNSLIKDDFSAFLLLFVPLFQWLAENSLFGAEQGVFHPKQVKPLSFFGSYMMKSTDKIEPFDVNKHNMRV
jgi:hypothetical protein